MLHKILNPTTSIPLFHLPHSIKAAEDVYSLLRFYSEVKVCVGNPDAGLIEQMEETFFLPSLLFCSYVFCSYVL